MDFRAEQAALARAEQDIIAGERRVSAQRMLIGRLQAAGDDTCDAERLLRVLQENLAQWYAHRSEILKVLGSSGGGGAEASR